MKLYLIGGLGADHRVFKFLNLKCDSEVIEWIEPQLNENLKSYVLRLSKQISSTENFGILGVSIGGIIAIELSKILNPKQLIIISSVLNHEQLPFIMKTFGKSGLIKLLPNFLLKPPRFIFNFLFGAKNKSLLNQIIDDTNPIFVRWSLNEIGKWKNESTLKNVFRIHGTSDKVIPLKGDAVKIEKGGHFMIADRSNEISDIINNELKYAG